MLKDSITDWYGPNIRLANGQVLYPEKGIEISINLRSNKAQGVAVIMPLTSAVILLGNDFLKQFGSLNIRYTNVNDSNPGPWSVHPEITVASKQSEIFVYLSKGVQIPAQSMVPVEVESDIDQHGNLSWIVEPSVTLFTNKGASLGHSIITDKQRVCRTNLTHKAQFVPEGTCLAKLEPMEGSTSLAIDSLEDTSIEDLANPTELREKLDSRMSLELTGEEKSKLSDLLFSHRNCFADSKRDLGHCDVLKHEIITGDVKPIHQKPYPSAFKQRELLQTQVAEMLKDGVIEPSCSPWSSPVILVKKKDGTWRFCADYRKLNNVTVKDVYPLPRIDDALSRLEKTTIFSIMDLQAGFWQLDVHPNSKEEKTAFITPDGLWQFKKMPFGLCKSPASFQRMMDIVLSGLKWRSCLVYLDDVIVFSETFEEHLQRLGDVLTAIGKAGLRLKISKCSFGETSIQMLGHVVDKDGVRPDPEKIRAVIGFPRPTDVKSIQSFVGLCSYYRKFIPSFAEHARPLTQLTKSTVPFQWGEEQETSLEHLKQSLTANTILGHPDYSKPKEIHPVTLTSPYRLGL